MKGHTTGNNRRITVWEIFPVFLSAALVFAIGHYRWEEAGGRIAGDTALYLNARIPEAGIPRMQWKDFDTAYTTLLTVLCTFLGNREEVVLWANQALWILALLFCCGGARRLWGRKGGFLVLITVPALAFCMFSMASAHSSHLAASVAAVLFWIACCAAVLLYRPRQAQEKAEEADAPLPVTASVANDRTGQPEEKKIRLLDNPLPVPKKHVRKEMDYAFDPPPQQMEYDLQNYDMNDDYDLHTF